MKTSIKEIDEVIHRERIDGEKKKVTHQRRSSDMAEGTFVAIDAEPYLFSEGKLHRWTPFGYEHTIDTHGDMMLTVLTPGSVVNAFRAGYVPQKNSPGLHTRG